MNFFYKAILFIVPVFLLSLTGPQLHAQQVRVSGTVYDMTRTLVLPAVSVMSNSGVGTTTDSNGTYSLVVNEKDSIWFSYLNKPTPKFAVSAIVNANGFDISLHVPVTELREVRVVPRNYKIDSMQNRLDYAKGFNYKKPGIKLNSPEGGFGVGIDLDELIGMFNFQKNRRMAAFRQRLIREEEDKAIDHRFTRGLVKKLTGLDDRALDEFMKRYRPSYHFAMNTTDYEFGEYIKLAYLEFRGR